MNLVLLLVLSLPAHASLEARFRDAGEAAAHCAHEIPGQACYDLAAKTMQDYGDSRSYRERTYGEERRDYEAPVSLLQGHPTDKAYVVVHSYTMQPREMNWLSDALFAKGANVIQVLLEGHGSRSVLSGGPVSLRDVKRQDWQQDVQFGIQIAHALGKKVVLVGYSLGGILSILEGSKENPEIAGFLAVAPPVAINDKLYGGPGACTLKGFLRRGLDKEIGKHIGNSAFRKAYLAEYVDGACELLGLTTVFNHTGRSAGVINNAFRFENTFRGEHSFTDIQRADFHRLKVPYVVVSSPHDNAIDHETLKRLVGLSGVPGQLFESNVPNHLSYGLARPGSADYDVFQRALEALDLATGK